MQSKMNVNYLMSLEDNEKKAYLEVLAFLTKADGVVDEDEKEFIAEFAGFCGMDNEETEKLFGEVPEEDILNDVKKIANKRVALELIKDMCFLAHRDENLSDEEVVFIARVGQALGITVEKIEQISKWVIDRIIWLEEEKIIFEEI